jgi:hypothetical protein
MNIATAASAGLAPAEGDSGQARAGLKQSWMKSLEQAWRQAPGEAPRHGRDTVAAGSQAIEPVDAQAAPVVAWQHTEQLLATHAATAAAKAAPQGSRALGGAGPDGARLAGRASAALCAPVMMPVPQPVAPRAALPVAAGPVPEAPELPNTPEPIRASRAPHEPLAPRSLLALPEGDGLAVWVRDGALAERDGVRLADGLRRAARELGMNLRRVAVNGRTAYDAADAPAARLTEARR